MAGPTGRDTLFGAKIASTWGTEVAIGAGSGIKMEKVATLLGANGAELEKTVDTAFPCATTIGNVPVVDYPIETTPRFCSSTSAAPLDQMLMACLYAATTATQQGGTAAYVHTGSVTSNVAYQNTPSRIFTLAARLTKASGYKYLSVPSWLPTGFEISSEAGSKVKLSVKGMGNRVVVDGATNGATQFSAFTYLDATGRLMHHHMLGNDGTNGGVWLLKSAAVGGSPVTFTRAAARIQPTSLSITYDGKMEDNHTDSQYTDSPYAGDVPEGKVKIKLPQVRDADWDADGVVDIIKDFEAGSEQFMHFKSRWTWPTAIASSYYPYLEVLIPALRVTDCKYDVDAGKVVPLEMEFDIVAPTAYSHLPATFTAYGGATQCKDPINIAICNQTTAAILP